MKNLRCKFIVLFLICSGSLFSQTYSLGNQSKWNQLSNVLVSCDLNLLKDNRYYILLSVGTSELVQNIFPSYGFFHKEGNMYYLQDIPSGANIVLEEINHSNLIVRKGFSFMENELFFYENDADDSFSYLLDFKDRCESVRTYSLESKDKKNIEIQPLALGTYRNGFVSLFLDLDFCYKIYYLLDGYSCLLSEGKWSKENNELFFYDPVLEYSFKGFVQSDGLRMTRFPNELNLKWDYHLVSDEAYPFIVW